MFLAVLTVVKSVGLLADETLENFIPPDSSINRSQTDVNIKLVDIMLNDEFLDDRVSHTFLCGRNTLSNNSVKVL